MLWSSWHDRREHRRELARRAVEDPSAATFLLRGWVGTDRPGASELLEGLEPAPGPGMDRLVAWVFGQHEPPSALTSEVVVDAELIARGDPPPSTPEQRRVAAWYLLGRLGEEVRARDVGESAASRPELDARALAAWTRTWRMELDAGLIRELRSLHGGAVRRAFRAVCEDLGLPRSVAETHARDAVERLEDLPMGPHLDVTARAVAASGPPVRALGGLLGVAQLEHLGVHLAADPAWRPTVLRLGVEGTLLADDLEPLLHLHLLRRLRLTLERQDALPRPHELPRWGVVSQGRGRFLGRLRSEATQAREALIAAARGLDGLHARLDGAVGRWAWAWAWREARAEFAFNFDRMRDPQIPEAPPGEPPAGSGPSPASPPPAPAVRTFLLAVIASGTFDRLELWIDGGSARDIPDRFYRVLRDCRGAIRDPDEEDPRSARYDGLRVHLSECLDDYRPALLEVAARVSAIPVVADRKRVLHRALESQWHPSVCPFPGPTDRVIDRFRLYFSAARPNQGLEGDP